jgi:four helix bundle protein
MNKEALKQRTKQYALRIIRLINVLPKTVVGYAVSRQLIRSGTSVGANYRAVCRSRSKAEFISKLGTVIEEADESAFWLEIIIDSKLMKKELIEPLLAETNEIVAIMSSSRITASKK